MCQKNIETETAVVSKSLKRLLVVGTFRSGTNAVKKCLEDNFHVCVTFNEWFWKHIPPPTSDQIKLPSDLLIVIMSKSPSAFVESIYPFFIYRRKEYRDLKSISEFLRFDCIVYDNTPGKEEPKYWFRNPIEYWNHYYYSWLNWNVNGIQRKFLKYEELRYSTNSVIMKIAEDYNLERKNENLITLPTERVGPHVPTNRSESHYILKNEDFEFISKYTNEKVSKSLGYNK